MYLRHLHLRQFRNYLDQKVNFDAAKTILVGDNAQGKSNLLESVELLSTLKSHRVSRDRDLILDGKPAGQIQANLERQVGNIELTLTVRSQGRRTVAINGETLRRHLDFLSILNVVQFSSLDLDLVRGGPEVRRHWLDRLLVQLEPVYAHILQQYNQVLRQRNALLKQIRQQKMAAETTGSINPISTQELALWDAQLATTGARVIRRRQRVLQRLAPLASEWHRAIAGNMEVLRMEYLANVMVDSKELIIQDSLDGVRQAFLEKIKVRAIAEQYQGTTVVGPHRDDVVFTINDTPARQYASQGQQRTLVLALKLAELQLIEQVVREPPLLLLDDVLAELDLHRQNQLLEAITDRFQTLITTTHLGCFDGQWLQDTQILSVRSGQISYFWDF
ncbi:MULTISPECIES: DNA replication/repair protein RecF [Okeania]|uniref:DNA replication and repair protein RecF n=1 Tax=Okeania hirsuta TaxID=1458930 RepID=A0A3N6RTY3_9CYAN|nr:MULTISPECIES: DNA replication/repair protein RecF [Okeania]NES78620.1 DNA replication/repair protein RecF [Okeania sp. SIO1H4]NES92425.1 DNA replication/repair protein RecF [Okeania sp. SIO2B9]NET22109.1 DNA replication/repair protein RecF [Okeania sp. SIO1H5]NET78091.1 DNA replication/repair protein RecF [Okeania sp. SIO1F9]NET95153.1 DNA replication/repair protein RecF [Okeania sp. SIO1H2]